MIATAAAEAKPTATAAATKLENKIEAKYPRLTRDRLVVAKCHKRTRREYYCLYGIHANQDDAIDDPDTRWVYSGVGYVRIRGNRLVADPLKPRAGDDFAPF